MDRFHCPICNLVFIRDYNAGYCAVCGYSESHEINQDHQLAEEIQDSVRDTNVNKRVHEILRSQPNVLRTKLNGAYLIHYAALAGNMPLTSTLLSYGAAVDARSRSGGTALHWLFRGFSINPEIVSLLVGHGADVDARDEDLQTPLIRGVRECPRWDEDQREPGTLEQDSIERAIEKLLHHGAKVNAVDKTGRSALHFAAMSGNASMVKLLLDRGADANLKDEKRRTVMDAWSVGQNKATKTLLAQRMAGSLNIPLGAEDGGADDSEVDSEDELGPESKLQQYFPK